MDINELREKGAFVQLPPVPTEASWTHSDGNGGEVTDTFIIHVRKMSVGWIDRVFDIGRKSKKSSRTAAIISEAILFGENGEEKMTYEQAFSLDYGLSLVLVRAFNKVNYSGGPSAKNSQPPTNSGASSSEMESAAEQ